MNLEGKTVCFIGDSITEGCGASALENGYVSLFAKAHPETIVHNYGIGGTRLADQTVPCYAEWEHPFYTRLKNMVDKADLICVFGGVNDFIHGDAPMGKWGDQTPATFYGGLYKLSVDLLKKYPEARIVFFTPLHKTDDEKPNVRVDGGWILKDYVNAVKENAEYFAFPVLDLWATSGIQPNITFMQERYTADGLHPNDAGYQVVFKCVDAFIKGL